MWGEWASLDWTNLKKVVVVLNLGTHLVASRQKSPLNCFKGGGSLAGVNLEALSERNSPVTALSTSVRTCSSHSDCPAGTSTTNGVGTSTSDGCLPCEAGAFVLVGATL